MIGSVLSKGEMWNLVFHGHTYPSLFFTVSFQTRFEQFSYNSMLLVLQQPGSSSFSCLGAGMKLITQLKSLLPSLSLLSL